VLSRSDFLRIGAASRDGKSPTGVPGKANRRGLLCGVMAKVQLTDTLFRGSGFLVPLFTGVRGRVILRSSARESAR
jgi:hypothetical protein